MVASHHDAADLTAAAAVTATSLRKSKSAGSTSKDHFAADPLPKSAAAAGSQPAGCLRKRPRTDSTLSHLLAGPNAECDSDPAAAKLSSIYISRLRRSISISKFVEKRTKKIRLYRNGDRFYSGMMFVVSLEHHRTFTSLLVDLTDSVICDRKLMPFGVRYLFEIDTGRRVTSLEQLEEGNCYVCSTSAAYRHIDYLGIGLQPLTRRNWHTTDDCLWQQPSARRRDRTPDCVLSDGRGPTTAAQAGDVDAANLTFVRPRIVTIIRNGSRPRRTVRVLLNRKTAQTFEQVLTEISEAIKLDSGAVKRIYSFDGKQVTSLYDFFRDDNVFIAFGCERPTFNDFDLTEREASNITMTCMRSSVRQQRSFTPRSSLQANTNGEGGRSNKLKTSVSARSINAIAADKNSAVDDVICSPTIIVPILKPDNQSKQTHQPAVVYRSNPVLTAEPPLSDCPSGSHYLDSESENLSEDVITDSSVSNMFSASSGVTVCARSASSVLPSSSQDRSSPAVSAAVHIVSSSSVSLRSSTTADTNSPTVSVTMTPSPNPSPRTNPNHGSLVKVVANSETPRAYSVVRQGRPSTSRTSSPAAAAATAHGRKTPTRNGRDKLKQKTATSQAALTNTAKDSCKSHSTGGVRSRKATIVNRILAGTAGGDHNFNEPKNLRIRYKIGKVIGQGNFAIVKECTEKFSVQNAALITTSVVLRNFGIVVEQKTTVHIPKARNLRFALKIIDKSKCRGTEQKIENEVAILRRLRHPNVIQLIDDFNTPDYLYMIMELITGGDLFESITEAIKYTERDASSMMYHIACAVNYLHSLNIVHRDIKPENLLVHQRQDGTKSLKLGDFGLAAYVSRPLYTVCGTLTYVAPEILTEVGYGMKVDIWSVGVIAYILLCGFAPFASDRRDNLVKQIMCGTFEFVVPYWNDISKPAKELIKHLLEVDVDKRFSAKQLLEYPWVAEDTAEENDLHHVIVNRRAEAGRIVLSNSSSSSNYSSNVICGLNFKSNRLPQLPRQAGVAILAVTALDKDFDWSPTANSSQSSHLSE